MYHGDLHVGNILVNDKKKFVFIDFERCVSQTGFVDVEEKKLLCYLEKLYVFRFFFALAANTSVELHQLVHKLFVNYFTDQLKHLVIVDTRWTLLFLNLLLGDFSADYRDQVLQKKLALNAIFEAEYFVYNSKRLKFYQYLQQKRFKLCLDI